MPQLKVKNLLNCTRAIFFENGDGQYPFSCGGTAFLTSYGSKTYFVTAKHVAERFPVEAPRILVRPDRQDFIPFDKRTVLKSSEAFDTDHADLATFRTRLDLLRDQDLGDFGPIDLSAVRIDPVPPEGARLVFQGFPTDRTKVDYEAKKLNHFGAGLSGHYKGKAESAGCHVIQIANPNEAPTTTLDGFSGSPVFWVAETGKAWFGFCGLIIRGTLASGECRYLEGSILISALSRTG